MRLTQKRLRELLHYDSESGLWTRRVARGGQKKGVKVGCHEKQYGYRLISVDNVSYKSARLAWLYVYGEFPDGQIDHINHIRTDDRISNLRVVSHQENGLNQKLYSRNKSGCAGVNWKASVGRWRAWIQADKSHKHLGYFDFKQKAIAVRKAAEYVYGYHPNHGLAK